MSFLFGSVSVFSWLMFAQEVGCDATTGLAMTLLHHDPKFIYGPLIIYISISFHLSTIFGI